jgi:hypothetical protein
MNPISSNLPTLAKPRPSIDQNNTLATEASIRENQRTEDPPFASRVRQVVTHLSDNEKKFTKFKCMILPCNKVLGVDTGETPE